MNKYIKGLILTVILLSPKLMFSQETSIQFPRVNFQMNMNQDLSPSVAYFIQNDIVVGDKSGIVFTTAVSGSNLNLQSDINSLIDLNVLKFTVAPSSLFNFNAFYGTYKFLAEDPVLPNGWQYNYSPGMNMYGIMPLFGAGIAITIPISDGRYEPELIAYSSSFNGIDYLNTFLFMTFRTEFMQFELYTGISVPTIGSIDNTIHYSGGFMLYTTLDLVNVYASVYIPPNYGSTEFSADDIYIRISQYLLIDNVEQTFSITSLGAETGNLVDPLVGLNSISDFNIYASIGGRINNIGFGAEYGFIYGLYESELLVSNDDHLSHRMGIYLDASFLGLTYRTGIFYTLTDSAAYIKENTGPGEVGFYISVFGRA